MYLLILVGISAVWYLTTIAITARRRQEFQRQNGCETPARYPHKHPWPLSLLGLDYLSSAVEANKTQSSLKRETDLHAGLGNTFTCSFLGTRVLNTIEPENIKTVLSTNFNDFEVGWRRKAAFEPLLGHSIFQSDGQRWAASRALLRPCFQRAQYSDISSLLEEHVGNLIDNVPKDGREFDLSELFYKLLADIASNFLFGESSYSLKSEKTLDNDLLKALQLVQSGCEMRWLLGGLASFWPQPVFWKCINIAHRFIQKHVDAAISVGNKEREGNSGEGTVFLEQLSKATSDRKVLQDELLTLYLAGSDTTASLLTNLFFDLARHPDVWKKLREQVAHLDGQVPTTEQLLGLPYVRYCIQESLRVHPPQPSNSRFANKDIILPKGGGPDGSAPVFVSKGTMVHFATHALHRRSDLWGDDANQFLPERWVDEKLSWKYIPFLKGPRDCVGMDFALKMATYIVTRLVQTFKSIESRDPNDWVEGSGLAMASRNGTRVVVKIAS